MWDYCPVQQPSPGTASGETGWTHGVPKDSVFPISYFVDNKKNFYNVPNNKVFKI